MKTEKNFQVLDLSGSPAETGLHYGKLMKEAINNLVEYLFTRLEKRKYTREKALLHARKHIPYIEEYSPEIAEELKGIAEGSTRLYEEIVLIHMHEEWSASDAHNCTAFALTGAATENGENYISQTWDIPKCLCENAGAFLLRVKRDKDPAYLAYTYAGMLAGAGLNSQGISLVWNSVPRLAVRVGVPTYVIIAEVFRQKKIGDALAAIFRAERAGCFNFVIADESEIYNIEATPDDVHITSSESYLCHANHYLSDKFGKRQDLAGVGSEYSASTIIRQNRINRMIRENLSRINLDLCKGFLTDHVNFPESICRHPDPDKAVEKRLITCASFVILPASRDIWITRGPACKNPFNRYSL